MLRSAVSRRGVIGNPDQQRNSRTNEKMKTLVRIAATNIKGQRFSLDLTELNLLLGSNFKGKTARLDAIRLLLLGHLPELGKLPRATFQLSSGREMSVQGLWSDGSTSKRRWFASGDSVRMESEGIEDHPGDAVMLDASRYFGLSDRERTAYVFANVPGAGTQSNDDFFGHLARELGGDSEVDQKAVARLVEHLESSLPRDDMSAQEYLDWILASCVERAKNERAAAVTFEKTAQGLSAIRTAETPAVDSRKLDALREELNASLREAGGEWAKLSVRRDNDRAARRRREELQRQVASLADLKRQRATAAEIIATLEAELAAIPFDADEGDRLLREHAAAAQTASELSLKLANVEAELGKLAKRAAELEHQRQCPYCRSNRQGWKATIEAELRAATTAAEEQSADLKRRNAEAKALRDSFDRQIKAWKNAAGLRRGKSSEIETARRTLSALDSEIAGLSAKAEELNNLPAPVDDLDDGPLNIRIEDLNRRLREVEAQRTLGIGRQHDLKRLAEAEENRDTARANETAAKAAERVVRELQAGVVEGAFGGLLRTANAICAGLLPFELAYHDGEIGALRDGQWVAHSTFSGSEKAISYAGVQAALSVRASYRLMILDELGRLDDLNASKLLARIDAMIRDGLLDQFVGADVGRGKLYADESLVASRRLTLTAIG